MTSLDPSHLPGLHTTPDPTTGQAVYDSVSPLHSHPRHHPPSPLRDSHTPTPRTRRPTPPHRHRHDNDDDDDDDDDTVLDKVPLPPIPDLRFEQGVLASLRPFLHPRRPPSEHLSSSSSQQQEPKPEHQRDVHAAEKSALASTHLTTPADTTSDPNDDDDLLLGPLHIQWGQVTYVLLRDQVVFPLLQGILWGVAGFYLHGLWQWNQARRAARQVGAPRPSLLNSLGLRTTR